MLLCGWAEVSKVLVERTARLGTKCNCQQKAETLKEPNQSHDLYRDLIYGHHTGRILRSQSKTQVGCIPQRCLGQYLGPQLRLQSKRNARQRPSIVNANKTNVRHDNSPFGAEFETWMVPLNFSMGQVLDIPMHRKSHSTHAYGANTRSESFLNS